MKDQWPAAAANGTPIVVRELHEWRPATTFHARRTPVGVLPRFAVEAKCGDLVPLYEMAVEPGLPVTCVACLDAE